ncbi:MAG: lysophospholipase [Chloroflexota bacterium]
MKHQEFHLKACDGLDLYGQAWLTEKKAKALIVIVHGLGEHSARYAHVAQAFTDNNFNVYACDQRGHGKSGGKRGHTPSAKCLLDDITICIQYAQDKTGKDLPTFLYGHSLGGLEVLYYGLDEKTKLAGIISTAPALDPSNTEKSKVMLAKLLSPIMPALTLASGLDVEGLSRDPEVVADYKADPLVHDRVSVRLGMFIMESGAYILTQAEKWHLPLLLMHGTKDRLCNYKGSEAFAAAAKGDVTLKLWEGFFHEIHNEPEKEEVFQTVVKWIKSQLKKK